MGEPLLLKRECLNSTATPLPSSCFWRCGLVDYRRGSSWLFVAHRRLKGPFQEPGTVATSSSWGPRSSKPYGKRSKSQLLGCSFQAFDNEDWRRSENSSTAAFVASRRLMKPSPGISHSAERERVYWLVAESCLDEAFVAHLKKRKMTPAVFRLYCLEICPMI